MAMTSVFTKVMLDCCDVRMSPDHDLTNKVIFASFTRRRSRELAWSVIVKSSIHIVSIVVKHTLPFLSCSLLLLLSPFLLSVPFKHRLNEVVFLFHGSNVSYIDRSFRSDHCDVPVVRLPICRDDDEWRFSSWWSHHCKLFAGLSSQHLQSLREVSRKDGLANWP